jgi:acetyl esterase/lipase
MLILIIQIISLLFLIAVLFIIYKPVPIQALYNRYFIPSSNFTEQAHTTEQIVLFKQRKFETFLLRNNNADTLIVWFHGGCFIQDHPHVILPFLGRLRRELPNCDILTFAYPIQFEFNLNDTLLFANKLISDMDKSKYKHIYLGGDSAGVLLALMTARIEESHTLSTILDIPRLNITYTGIIAICGFYDITFNSNLFAKSIFKFYIGRNTPNWNSYHVREIITPTLMLTSKHDFLYNQHIRFATDNKMRNIYLKEFHSKNTVHCFVTNTESEETSAAILHIQQFITRLSTLKEEIH